MNLQTIFYILAIVYIAISLVVTIILITMGIMISRKIRRFRRDIEIRKNMATSVLDYHLMIMIKKVFR